ncbi:hypothetical protein F4810DRAFT_655027 [Camillea tinctor]|nr:hypothetical protein F4810DRAFT_655027 [Camillea tinctor]
MFPVAAHFQSRLSFYHQPKSNTTTPQFCNKESSFCHSHDSRVSTAKLPAQFLFLY